MSNKLMEIVGLDNFNLDFSSLKRLLTNNFNVYNILLTALT